MSGKLLPILLSVAAVVWIGVIAMSAVANWPHVPLDMGGKDPATAAAYQAAVTAHVMRAAIMALVPALAVGLVLLAFRRRGR